MILALDISLTTGIAWGGPQQARPRTSVWKLPEGEVHFDRALSGLRGSVMAMLKVEPIKVVAIEAAMQKVDWQHSAYAAYLLTSLCAVAREAAQTHGVEVVAVATSTWRHSILGTARLTTDEAKARAKKHCDTLGWGYQDHNAAEASCLWSYLMALKFKSWAPNAPTLPIGAPA